MMPERNAGRYEQHFSCTADEKVVLYPCYGIDLFSHTGLLSGSYHRFLARPHESYSITEENSTFQYHILDYMLYALYT